MRTVFGPVINSQSISFLLSLAILLILALIANGILEWIRERVLLSGTISFINKLERSFWCTFEQSSDKWSDGAKAFTNMRILRNFMVSPISRLFLTLRFLSTVNSHIFYTPLDGSIFSIGIGHSLYNWTCN